PFVTAVRRSAANPCPPASVVVQMTGYIRTLGNLDPSSADAPLSTIISLALVPDGDAPDGLLDSVMASVLADIQVGASGNPPKVTRIDGPSLGDAAAWS